jgi:hypothetical protein
MRSISFAWIAISLAWPEYPPLGWWIMILEWGRQKRWPGEPPQRSSEPMEAAWPMQIVVMGERM